MNRYRSLIVAAITLVFFIASGTAAAEKIGFINVAEVLSKSNAGKAAEAEFRLVVEKDRIAIQEREKELQKLKDELDKQRPLLKEDVLRAREADYQKRFRDYQLLVKDANEELQNKQQEIMKKLVPEIMKVVTAIGEKEKYTMVIDLAVVPLAYHDKANELTQRVIEEFNKAYTAPPAAKTPPAAKPPVTKPPATKPPAKKN